MNSDTPKPAAPAAEIQAAAAKREDERAAHDMKLMAAVVDAYGPFRDALRALQDGAKTRPGRQFAGQTLPSMGVFDDLRDRVEEAD
jgi:hypothetical protein